MRAVRARPNIVSPQTPRRHRGLRATAVSGRDVLVTPPMHRGFDKPDQVDTLLSHAHGCVAILTGRVHGDRSAGLSGGSVRQGRSGWIMEPA
ncbi:hypothetical protein [Azospirillum palustre]